MAESPTRFFGLDIHKEYFIAVGVSPEREIVFGPQRVSNYQLEEWAQRVLTPRDRIALEMTTNTYQFYDVLIPYVHSVIAVHPPNVPLVTNVHVKTDKKAAQALAQLHAAGMLTGVWIPPFEVRDRRALVARREKMVRLSTMAKNRLHAALNRHHLVPRKSLFHLKNELGGRSCRSHPLSNSWFSLIWRHLNLPSIRSTGSMNT